MATMFCYQCEQAAQGSGCTQVGVCGKDPEVAALQDLLIHQLKGIGYLGHQRLAAGDTIDENQYQFMLEAAFATLTNVDFDSERFVGLLEEGDQIQQELARSVSVSDRVPDAAQYELPKSKIEMLADAREVGILAGDVSEDVRSLRELIIYGLKGMAAYAHHAELLGQSDPNVRDFFFEAFASVAEDDLEVPELLDLALKVGETNIRVMELLDTANTEVFGHPEPTEARITLKKGPFIVVSGHDLRDLKMLLEQTEGTGVDVYTHGEMLPALAYPELKKHDHLVGNFGGAWQDQQKEFDGIPGAILMTTNCLQKPRPSYQDRFFTTGPAGWPGTPHIPEENGHKDFSAVIEKALELGGFSEDEPEKRILIGFGHQSTLDNADAIVEAVNSGALRHFFLIGGCDGARPGRNYFTEFAEEVPNDAVILTLACGKFRFNKQDFGTIGDVPRLIDMGQCNDAYSAVKVAQALAEAFDCDLNDLPLSMIVSWYEQKAVVILLSLLALGVKNIHLGPTLPAFLSSNVLDVLVDEFDLRPTTTVRADLLAILDE